MSSDVAASEGWSENALTDVADVTMGQSPPGSTYNTEGAGLPFFQGKAEFGQDHPTAVKWCTAPTRIAEPGDILMSVRAPVGPTNIADQRCAIGRGLAIIRPKAGVPVSLVRYAIKLQEDEIASWGTGTTFTAINKGHFKNIKVWLPPNDSRESLASLLDEIVTLRRSSIQRLKVARHALERFRQAVLAAACSGRLTADWRTRHPDAMATTPVTTSKKRRIAEAPPLDLDLPELPETYIISSIGAAAEVLEYGTSKKAGSDERGIAVLRMSNIQDASLVLDDLKYCAPDREVERLMLHDGDLLFNRTNSPELVGKAAVFHEPTPMTFASYLIRVRFASDVADPDFVNYWVNSAWGRTWARHVKTDGVSQSNINGTKLGAMPLPLPPIDEQRAIVQCASQMLASANAVLGRLDATSRSVDRSSQAVLARAFRGELLLQKGPS